MSKEYLEHLIEEFNDIDEKCNKCHGNFNDDCRLFDMRENLRTQIDEMKKSLNKETEEEDDKIRNIALKAYPVKEKFNKTGKGTYDPNFPRRKAFIDGYKQAVENLRNKS